jgi:N-formylmaleamate deformylase
MNWTEGDVDLGDARIHYYRRGDGPPVVLAHGATDDGRCWGRVAERLEDGYELIAYDARGHGKSSDITRPQPPAGDDLLAVVSHLGLDRPVAMGHSMGAGAVADAASRAPDALRAAILEDPGWRAGQLPAAGSGRDRMRSFTGWVDELKKMSLDEVIASGRKMMPAWHPDEIPPWAESKLLYRPVAADPSANRPDWRQQAAAIKVPLLLLCGDPTKALVDEQGAAEAQQLCRTCEVHRFDAGHNIRREAFDEFVTTVRAFLDRVYAGADAPDNAKPR